MRVVGRDICWGASAGRAWEVLVAVVVVGVVVMLASGWEVWLLWCRLCGAGVDARYVCVLWADKEVGLYVVQ